MKFCFVKKIVRGYDVFSAILYGPFSKKNPSVNEQPGPPCTSKAWLNTTDVLRKNSYTKLITALKNSLKYCIGLFKSQKCFKIPHTYFLLPRTK